MTPLMGSLSGKRKYVVDERRRERRGGGHRGPRAPGGASGRRAAGESVLIVAEVRMSSLRTSEWVSQDMGIPGRPGRQGDLAERSSGHQDPAPDTKIKKP
jgi:hypothetical protein